MEILVEAETNEGDAPELDTVTEAAETPAPVNDESAALAELDALLAGEKPAEEPTETLADDEGSVEQEVAVEEAKAPVPEGPSAEMKQIARMSGVPDWIVNMAQNSAQLTEAIEHVREAQTAQPQSAPSKDEPEAEDLAVDFVLPEEEFGADDPVAKQTRAVVEKHNKLVKQLAEVRETNQALLKFATSQIEEKKQSQWRAVQEPIDATLDSYESDVFGNSASMNAAQRQARAEVWERLTGGLGVNHQTPKEKIASATELYVAHSRPDVAQRKAEAAKAKATQPTRVLGGRAPKSGAPPKASEADLLARLDEYRTGRIDRTALLNGTN